MRKFIDRKDAGKQLALALSEYARRWDVAVLGLPRGGVPVAYEVAKELHLPLDVWIVRKLGVPEHEEVAMGALAIGCDSYIDHELVNKLHIPESAMEAVVAKELKELRRRNKLYRDDKPAPAIEDKTIILIDDGIATGATMRAAILALREAGARDVIASVPVGPVSAVRDLEDVADKVICLYEAEPFYGVGMWYRDFSQTSDAEVLELLGNQPWINAKAMKEAS